MTNTTTSALRAEHARWSQETFGNVGPIGPLKHLSKEALEAAQNPADLSEWADIIMLTWDAQRRAGITDEQLMQAVAEKLAINKARKWPKPCDGEPREHVRGESNNAQPAEPVAFVDPQALRNFKNKKSHREWMWAGTTPGEGLIPVFCAPPAASPDIAKLVEGMFVSVDVSTCDADAGNRYFGTVSAVQEHNIAKNGVMLLVEDAQPNFVADAAPVVPDAVHVARAALDYIDALPADVVASLPAMPGFDRDWAEAVLSGRQAAQDNWIPCSERMPDKSSGHRVCVYTPEQHDAMTYRFVPASLFAAVCTTATHWFYIEPPAQEDGQR